MSVEGWESVQLGEVVTLHYGKALPRDERSPQGAIPVYGANGVKDYSDRSHFCGPSLIVGRKGSAGEVTRVDGPFWPLDVAYYTTHDRDRLDFDFLEYALSILNLPSMARGVKPGINRNDVYATSIPLPPLEDQRRIVGTLDEAFAGLARVRANAEANLADARDFFRNALRDVFRNDGQSWQTDATPDRLAEMEAARPKARSKATTSTGGRGATLRPIPGPYSLAVLKPDLEPRKGWQWSPLTALARLESGHTPSRKRPEYWGGDVPWIGIKDARDHHGATINETLENTNEIGIANSSARVLPAGTVCLSRTASVGYVTVMGRDMATSQDFVNWVCGNALLPEFLKLLLLAQGDDIRAFASGSVHQTIYFPEVKAFHICHPPIEVQEKICAAMSRVSVEAASLIERYEAKIADIDDLRQSLLQKAFSGGLS